MEDLRLLNKAFLRPDEVARLLRVSRSTVYRMVECGELPGLRIRGQIRIPSQSIREKVEELQQSQSP